MPWLVGIDEAGYGPNLGPLVMSAVACEVPESIAGADLWEKMASGVCRANDRDSARLPIDDSKAMYNPASGLAQLEASVLASAFSTLGVSSPLASLIAAFTRQFGKDLEAEVWYQGEIAIPNAAEPSRIVSLAASFAAISNEFGIRWLPPICRPVCPRRFNGLLDRWQSKGEVLAVSLVEIFNEILPALGNATGVHIHIDKHGGRNRYAPMLQDAFPDCFVAAAEECLARSRYEITGHSPRLEITFQARADQEYLCVALASMVSKYLRELLMKEFNAFWLARVPELRPTAGYPADAPRFFAAIRGLLHKLGLDEADVWRRK